MKRISITLSDSMLKRVDSEAKKIGTTRGAMLTTWVGEKINSLDMSKTLFKDMFNSETFQEFSAKYMAELKTKEVK